MGNCPFGGARRGEAEAVKVTTWNGGTMELYGAVTVESITDEFPGHKIFHSQDLFWKPIPHHQVLLPGNSYYLLPLQKDTNYHQVAAQVGHVRSNSLPTSVVPYRMSFDSEKMLNTTGGFSFSTNNRWYKSKNIKSKSKKSNIDYKQGYGRRVWKVKLVISPKQLAEILSQEGTTEELIESVRTVAKCGNTGLSSSSSSSSSAFSDEWSTTTTDDLYVTRTRSSTTKASSNKHGL